MAFSDKRLRTIKCDGPGCDKMIEFDLTDAKTIQETTWLLGVRVIQTGDNRSFSYCTDVCEVKGITTGQHNLKEQPKVVTATSQADIKLAAEAAQAAQAGTEALKSGEGKIQIAES